MDVVEVSGSPRAMGEAFGEECRSAIHDLYVLRLKNAVEQAATYGGRSVGEAQLVAFAERCLPSVRSYHPDGWEELSGLAAGAGLDVAKIWAMNALTDLRDVAAFGDLGSAEGEGCSSIIAHGRASASGAPLLGQTWDLATNNMPFVRVVHRRPRSGPETVCLTTVGCLSLIGMNASGLAIGTTNLRTVDARVGVGYLDVIHRVLAARTFEEGQRAIVEAPRAGAHYFYLSDALGRMLAFEGSATRLVEHPVHDDFRVQCNHAIASEVASLEASGMPVASSHARHARLLALAGSSGPLQPSDLARFFVDTEGGARAILRRDYAGISTNAAVILEPAERRFRAVRGPIDEGTWITRTLSSSSHGPTVR